MIRKLFTLSLLSAAAAATGLAQTPAPAPPIGSEQMRLFRFGFDNDGGYLGVQTSEITKDNFGKFGLREVRGVAVERVSENSPAAAAGLKSGDVILQFDGEPVESVRKLTRLIGEIAPDHRATIKIARGGTERDIEVTLAARPAQKFENGSFGLPNGGFSGTIPPKLNRSVPIFPTPEGEAAEPFTFGAPPMPTRQIGVGVLPLSRQLAEYFKVKSGLLVDRVRENSPAAKGGLKAGDIITTADGEQITGPADLVRIVSAKKSGDLKITVVRDGKVLDVSVTPEEVKAAPVRPLEWPQPSMSGV